jgi:hypothetical protein
MQHNLREPHDIFIRLPIALRGEFASRNSGAAIAGRVVLGVVHKRGSGAKTARSREGWRPIPLMQ